MKVPDAGVDSEVSLASTLHAGSRNLVITSQPESTYCDNKVISLRSTDYCIMYNRYELHYQLITFGKVTNHRAKPEETFYDRRVTYHASDYVQVFCTKRQPNCNACPMRGECRHFASAFARYGAHCVKKTHSKQRIIKLHN